MVDSAFVFIRDTLQRDYTVPSVNTFLFLFLSFFSPPVKHIINTWYLMKIEA